MSVAITVRCPGCGTTVDVMPSELLGYVAEVGGAGAEAAILEQVAEEAAERGDRVAFADAQGIYTCPACGERHQLPTAEELQQLPGDST